MSDWIDILDVSAYQGTIDWSRVAAARVHPDVDRRWRGVVIKVSEGETSRDKARLANLSGARAAGLLVGAYAFIRPTKNAGLQVANAWAAIDDTMPSFPLALDVEAAPASLTPAQLVDQIRRARDAVIESFGRAPLLYSYPDFWARRVAPAVASAPDLAELPLWWASYGAGKPWYPQAGQVPAVPEPWRSGGRAITIWQYSGNTTKTAGAWTGRVDGIAGDVDRNVFLGTEEEFRHGLLGQPRQERLEAPMRIVHPSVTLPRPPPAEQ